MIFSTRNLKIDTLGVCRRFATGPPGAHVSFMTLVDLNALVATVGARWWGFAVGGVTIPSHLPYLIDRRGSEKTTFPFSSLVRREQRRRAYTQQATHASHKKYDFDRACHIFLMFSVILCLLAGEGGA